MSPFRSLRHGFMGELIISERSVAKAREASAHRRSMPGAVKTSAPATSHVVMLVSECTRRKAHRLYGQRFKAAAQKMELAEALHHLPAKKLKRPARQLDVEEAVVRASLVALQFGTASRAADAEFDRLR